MSLTLPSWDAIETYDHLTGPNRGLGRTAVFTITAAQSDEWLDKTYREMGNSLIAARHSR